MADVAVASGGSGRAGRWLALLDSRVVRCSLIVVLLVAGSLLANGHALHQMLGDPDDATRLVEVREFVTGAGWFDMTLPRIGAPEPLVSHWSRLIDVGLVAVLATARLVVSPATAETVMRVVWPSLVLLAGLLMLSRESEREAGAFGGLLVPLLVATSCMAMFQFALGRIDHHNVQIVCAAIGVVMLARALAEPRAGWGAGALIGLGLGVGLEAASLIAPVLVLAVLMGLGRVDGLRGVFRAAFAMTAVLLAIVLATIEPVRLLHPVCDAVALNLVVLMAAGTAGVALAAAATGMARGAGLVGLQLAALAASGVIGVAAYGALEPACLAGPFGQVDPAAWPIWLSQVQETQPLTELAKRLPAQSAGFVLFALVGIAARAWFAFAGRAASAGARDVERRREYLLLGAQVIVLMAALWQIKMTPYAAWLAVPAVARLIAGLPAYGSFSVVVTRLAAMALLAGTTLDMVGGVGMRLATGRVGTPDVALKAGCADSPTIARLAALPQGLILSEVDIGSYIVALTPHRVVMAPYHRLGHSIVEGMGLLASPTGSAYAGLRRLGVDYVVACRESQTWKTTSALARPMADGRSPADTLLGSLIAGKAPRYLEPVALADAAPLFVWRVKPAADVATSGKAGGDAAKGHKAATELAISGKAMLFP